MEKTSNVTVRLYEVMKFFLIELRRLEGHEIYHIVNNSMGSVGNAEPLPLSVTLRNYFNLISLLLETEQFMLKHDEMPQRYLQTIKKLIEWFTSNSIKATTQMFSSAFPSLEYNFFEELKFSSRSEREEEYFESIYIEIHEFATDAAKTIDNSDLPDNVKKHLEHLLFQLIRSSNSYKYNGKAGFDETLNQFIAEMGRSTQHFPNSSKIFVDLMLKAVFIAEKMVLIGDVSQLPNTIMKALMGGE